MYQWVAPSKHIITSHNFVGLICPQDTASCGDPVEKYYRGMLARWLANIEHLFRGSGMSQFIYELGNSIIKMERKR